ncbi:DUF736 domain-containing protein [Magnetospirillum sp. 64-120]|uniref:DUF736 domain-containing protein n=1 Tax=Magnetospirillum sp. 64-120 TaxID=1895778 RepID=UPI000925B8B2|nr:DUF736 domain-containing protein [Magnetospirillum sp. 64-120]OJX78636.1 MAG: hypothetical protein BGO92_01620 [Magnetospirillum sp. 64-120]
MAHIGNFTRTAEGYTGHLRTLTLDIELTLVPADHAEAENAPDYRIHLGADTAGPEVGAGWKRTGERAGDYVALLIDDPALAQPLRANLFQSDAKGKAFALLWTRPAKRDDKR